MKGKEAVLTTVGVIVGLGEALVYYSMGKSEGHGFKIQFPPRKEFLKTLGVVVTTSIITTLLFTGLEYVMAPSENKNKQLADKKQPQ